MAYSDFDLQSARERFGLTLIERDDLFAAVAEVEPGESLRRTLERWAPIALALNTEKARSEMIIAPILMEVVGRSGDAISLFSGVAFDVDREQGLNGTCDFLLAKSPEQYYLSRPVIAIVEAKKEDIVAGLGQCVAALVAAQMFNARSGDHQISPVFGAVTTGNNWRFLKAEGSTVWIDRPEYYLGQIGKILGILVGVAV
jgi:hypothetical protein